MSDEKLDKSAAVAETPVTPSKKTLKDVVLDGLEEKGMGKDAWLWWVENRNLREITREVDQNQIK